MMRWTLGTKLTAWSALLAGVVLVICGISAALFIKQEQIEALDEQLTNQAHTFFRSLKKLEKLPGDRLEEMKAILPVTRTTHFVEVLGRDGQVLFSSLPRGTAPARAGFETMRIGRKTIRLGVFTMHDLTLRLGAELSEINADESEIIFALCVALPLLMATIAGGGWWLARKALAPVREITAATEQITAERLHHRLVPRTRDELGRLTEVLNAMLDRLEKSFHQAMRFSADASHELKTPLTVLRAGFDDLLESTTLSASDQRAVAALLEQTRRLSSITESLLLLSRADAGGLRLDLGDANAAEIITACVDDARIIGERRRITIETELPAQLRARLDGGRFSQILLNLLDNAVKYNRDGGEIKVAARSVGGGVTITVANTGPGIPVESVGQLFDRFYRFDPHRGNVGHGLGLSIARELARAHGGDLELTSSDAQWTVFTLRVRASADLDQMTRAALRPTA